MSKLERLIQQYCPDGVEYVRLVDYVNVLYGCPFDATQFTDDNSFIPLIRIRDILSGKAGTYYKGDYSQDYIIKKGDILVGMDGNFNLGIWNDIDGLLCQRVCKLYTKDETRLLNGFIRHYMKPVFRQIEESTPGGSVKHLSAKAIKSIRIPLPPLPVQEEIVRILDTFTELQAELQAELQKRQQQYNFYRDNLLNFNRGGQEIKWMKLKEIGKVCMCKRILKEQTVSSGDVPFYKIGTFGGVADAYIPQELFDSYKSKFSYPQKGDILISAAGTIGRTVEFDGKPAYFQDSNIVWIKHDESIVLNSYLKYCYTQNPWAISTGGTIARLYNDNILNATIPVPPIAEQQKIVAILDRFDTLTNDLTSGLPAEMEKRRQQYEYYRDRLLTFKRL